MTAQQVADITFYQRSPHFSDKEKAVLLFAEKITRGAATVRDEDLKDLRKFLDDSQVVELTLLVCVANFTNRFNDALGVVPDLGV